MQLRIYNLLFFAIILFWIKSIDVIKLTTIYEVIVMLL